DKLPGFVDNLLSTGAIGSYKGIISMVLGMFMSGSATKNGSVTDYSITISPRKLVNLKDLLGILGGALANLPIDINALMSWLDENIPNVDFTINASLNSQGAFVGNPSMQVVDNTNGESTFTFNTSTLKITSWDGSNSSNLDSIVPDYISDYTTWSLGNIKFSVNLDAATSSGAVDVGALINTFVPGTLPQNLIILDLSLGYRLDFILDLDIKQENPAEDKNLIAPQLFEKGKPGAGNAVLGVYYRNGSLYVNIGGILNNLPAASGNGQISRLWDGKGIKIDGIRLNELISALKERVVKEIDNLFGTDHGKIEQRNAESSMSLLQEYDSIMALSVDGNGDTYIAPGWGNFISMLFKVLKVEGDYVNVTNGENGGTLSITINNNLIDSVLAAVKGFGVNLPEGFAIPDIGEGELYIKVNNSGLDSIGLNHSIGGIDLSLSLSDFLLLKPITFNDGDMQIELCEYVDSCIGEAGNYTTSINELLMDVLYGGIKGSINLDLSFSGGEYNISQLLSMFGLSLGDIKLIVDNPNAKIALGLDFGFYIDEENPDENSSLYLELVAREPVYLENPVGGNAILDEGIILGIYLYKNALYLDASHLKILNLQMPIYKMDNMGIGSFIEALLAQLADINLSLDMSGVIDAIRGSNTPDNGEQEAAAALADITSNSNGVLRTSQTISTQSAISLYLGSDAVKLSATVSAVFALLEAFNVNLGIDISKYVSGEIPLEIQYKDGALSLSVSGNILPTVDGKDSNLSLQLGIDLADINIAGCKQEIADKVDGVGSSYDDGLNDNLIEGILNAVLDTQISVGVTLRQGKLDVLKLVDYLLDVLNVSVSLSDLDVNGSISADSLDVTLNIKLAMSNASNPLLGLDLVSTESGREETLLGFYLDKDNAYINLAMLGLGKYKVSNTGLMGIITDLLDSIGSEITLKGLLGIDNLLDLGKSLNAKVVESDIYGRYIAWNRYGQASDIRYTVYGIGEGSNGEQTQTDLFGSFSHNDTAKFADGKFKIDLSAEEYDVYSAFKIVVFTVKDGGNKVLLSATAVPEQFDYSATAEYADAAATTVRFNVFDKGYTYRLQKNAGNGFVDVNIDAAVIDGIFEIVLDGTGVTAYKVIISGANNVKIDEFEIIPTQVQPEEIAKSGLSVNINDEQKLVSWSAEEGAEYYEVSLTEKGAAAPSWTTRVSSVNNLTTRWYSDYKYYTVTVVAYSAEGEVLNSGSSSTSYNVIDAILSGLTIKNGVIGLDITGKIFGDIFANLIGEQYRIEILNVSLSDVNIFTGTANLSLSIFDSVGPDAGSITLDASLSISPTDTIKLNSDINAMNAPNSEYAEIDLAYGGNVVRGIWDIFEEGVMLGAQFELAFAKGSYDLSNLFALLGGDIAKIFEAGPVWTFTEDTSIKVDLSAAVIMDDVNTISPEGQDKLPEGMLKAPQIMVSLAFPDGLVLGSNVAIKKGESVDILLKYDGLGIYF
ncbi:MAG: hypothetical protein K2I79_03570, partial [Clostridia bacterium]|nr:hypothetical protein [Clostridia bacterium]